MRFLDLVLRTVGGILAALLGAASALLEAMATAGWWMYPVVAAIVGNAFLVWFARSAVDTAWSWWLPAGPWFAVMVMLAAPTAEGDQIANSWVGLGTLAAGALTFFWLIATGRTGPPPLAQARPELETRIP